MNRCEMIRSAESSIKRYKKLNILIDNGIREMFFIRDMMKEYSDDHVNKRLKEQAAIEKAQIDQCTIEKAEILEAIDQIDSEAFQTLLKCIYIEEKSPVEVMGLTAKEVREMKEEALLKYGKEIKDVKRANSSGNTSRNKRK